MSSFTSELMVSPMMDGKFWNLLSLVNITLTITRDI
jgi:hypothetical protein